DARLRALLGSRIFAFAALAEVGELAEAFLHLELIGERGGAVIPLYDVGAELFAHECFGDRAFAVERRADPLVFGVGLAHVNGALGRARDVRAPIRVASRLLPAPA